MSARRISPISWIVLASTAASLLLAVTVPLLDPDEGRNAEIAREMAVSGDLIVPRLAGMPYLDKPPGFFWPAALAIRLLGPIPFAARLPSILAAIATLLVLAQLARRHAGEPFAIRAIALLAVAPLFVGLAAYVIFDMALALCVTLVWTSLARELETVEGAVRPRASRGLRLVMFAATTAGILVKGPVMLAWSIGGSVAAALILRSRDPLRWLGWWPGWLLLLAIAGGWFALATARHPEYPRYAFLEESFERLTSGAFKREQPLWFVPAVLIGGAFPWSLTTPWQLLRRLRLESPPGTLSTARRTARVALGFVLFAVVFFSLSRSKLVTYLLPAFPPLAWLAGAAWSHALAESGSGRRRWFFASLAVPILMIAAAAPALVAHARKASGAPLAEAIRKSAPDTQVRYEHCYSPGTDYLLGRPSTLVSERGHEIRSTYQIRYRQTLIARGHWTPRDTIPQASGDDVVVRRARDEREIPRGYVEFFRDPRFAAFRKRGG
ncbi:MAG TPA: glycosyltransferase family 39 protein [Candidatus Limnocylindria bacterium]|nr:glycosyltransferase family 39 protein [Candidatus Limnocylindria bacterium]